MEAVIVMQLSSFYSFSLSLAHFYSFRCWRMPQCQDDAKRWFPSRPLSVFAFTWHIRTHTHTHTRVNIHKQQWLIYTKHAKLPWVSSSWLTNIHILMQFHLAIWYQTHLLVKMLLLPCFHVYEYMGKGGHISLVLLLTNQLERRLRRCHTLLCTQKVNLSEKSHRYFIRSSVSKEMAKRAQIEAMKKVTKID